jgi:hypothetical protein
MLTALWFTFGCWNEACDQWGRHFGECPLSDLQSPYVHILKLLLYFFLSRTQWVRKYESVTLLGGKICADIYFEYPMQRTELELKLQSEWFQPLTDNKNVAVLSYRKRFSTGILGLKHFEGMSTTDSALDRYANTRKLLNYIFYTWKV